MENKLQIFTNEQFGSVRIVEKDGEGWIVATDVCREVDVQNTSDALSRLDDDEKSTIVLTESATNGTVTHKVSIINEAGFYRLVLSSRKKDERVKKFQRWVTHEVLPAIRKHGMYATPVTIENIIANPDFGIELLMKLKAEREEKERLKEVVEVQNLQIAEMQPKASYYDLILQSKEAMPVSVIAKDYGLSGKAMNQLLHKLEIQYPCGGTWLVYQEFATQGYTQTKTIPISDGYSKTHTNWTQKGRLFLYETLKRHGHLPLIEQVEE